MICPSTNPPSTMRSAGIAGFPCRRLSMKTASIGIGTKKSPLNAALVNSVPSVIPLSAVGSSPPMSGTSPVLMLPRSSALLAAIAAMMMSIANVPRNNSLVFRCWFVCSMNAVFVTRSFLCLAA